MRHLHDFYPTEQRLAAAALAALLPATARTVLDLGAGLGTWGKALKALRPEAHLVGVEIDPRHVPSAGYDDWIVGDARTCSLPTVDAVIGNPPFQVAEALIHRALTLVPRGGSVLLLLRLGFLASQERYRTLWGDDPGLADVAILPARPSFTGDGKTDNSEYAVYHFVAGHTAPPALRWLDWTGIGAQRSDLGRTFSEAA